MREDAEHRLNKKHEYRGLKLLGQDFPPNTFGVRAKPIKVERNVACITGYVLIEVKLCLVGHFVLLMPP